MLDKAKIRLGIAPIAWTNDDMPELGAENTFGQCISEMALAGFEGTEIGNRFPKDAAVLKKALQLRGLSIANAWFSSFFTTKPSAETINAFVLLRDFLHQMGAKVIGVCEQGHSIQGVMDMPVFEKKPVFSDGEWKRLAEGLNRLGALASAKGIRVSYHHHMGTGVQSGAEIDRLMEITDPDLVFLLFDSGHLAFSGEDPAAVLKRHVSRVRHVHLKDIRQDVVQKARQESLSFLQSVKAGAFTVPGDGCIHFDELFDILGQHHYEGWMIVEAEQDPAAADPLEYAIRARTYIRQKTGL